eukprot:scaffold298865_cov37-Prasinocladus_malaysianus.AAC.1
MLLVLLGGSVFGSGIAQEAWGWSLSYGATDRSSSWTARPATGAPTDFFRLQVCNRNMNSMRHICEKAVATYPWCHGTTAYASSLCGVRVIATSRCQSELLTAARTGMFISHVSR